MIRAIVKQAMGQNRQTTHFAMVLAVAAALAGVGLLAISGWFLTGAALAGASGIAAVKLFNYLLPSAAIRTMAIVRTLGRYGERLNSHKAALHALAEVRPILFARLSAAAPAVAFFRPAGEVAAQLSGDVDAMEDAVIRQVTGPAAYAAAATGVIVTALSGWMAAAVFLIMLVAMRWVSKAMARALLPRVVAQRAEAMAALKSAYADYAPSSTDIAVYGLGETVAAALSPLAVRLDAARAGEVRAEAMITGMQTVLAAVSVAAVLLLAGQGVALAALSALGAAGATEIWAGLARNDSQAVRVAQSFDRLTALAELPPRVEAYELGCADAIGAARKPATLTLIIGGVAHIIAPGERVLLSGATGAGKSRLIGTLIGLRHDAPQGIKIDEKDARAISLDMLRTLFAVTPQDAALIAGTVADNLRLARIGVDEAAMWAALTTACLDDVVRDLPDGLDTWLGGDGARLSGGQRKRLSLARALLADRPWLVLDEPSEGLDAATEAEMARRLADWLDREGRGLLLVSHRTGLHHLADRVIAII